jgi:hypothetical protein
MPLVKWHSTNRESLITQIYDNTTGIFKPCTSSNGEVYDPPPKFIDGYDQLEITRNESISYPQPQTAILYKNAVNTDRFWGQAPGIWRCDKISPERQERQIPSGGRFPFLRTTYIFEANPAGWDLSLMDYGTFYLEEDPRNANPLALGSFPVQKRRFMTEDNHPTSGALNGRGGPLAQKIEVQIVDSASSVFTIAATTPSIKFQSGDLVQLSNTGGRLNSVKAIGGRTVQNPAPNYPMGLTQGGVYYVTNPGDTASGGQEFDLSPVKPTAANSSGQKLRVNDDGTGTHYISQPGVFFTIRPYKRLPFARLALPQGFAQVQ